MSVTTIEIPAEQAGAIRESLAHAYRELESGVSTAGRLAVPSPLEGRREIARLLDQLEAADAPDSASREITGSSALIWNAAYDALCAEAERVADECNEYWRSTSDPAGVRKRIAVLAARFDLVESLGAPPG